MYPEELEAAVRYQPGKLVRRVTTRADVTLIQEVLNELRLVARRCENGATQGELLPLIWHTLDWLPDAFTPGFRKLLDETRSNTP